ncbi:8-oxo-dGTP pyrophosphatase MutT (NUDIX family) [Oikeobacillus pervagus]|uniref:8-oxo-dGTP pyrophosphatase MutT (NUDIX family) n=1 Tax=Oikeobacillus pervagus TaxID=1325931 RepID=A0AAJ1WI42_9BACI|nr:CoA pyrophosphatase [Oikeobacillus pervagus]MDQ0213958.1 8-oxo-dGTP pyrophosphatase MutT (NUDIX family) [Oikeobacillus pervagus]
MNIESVFKKVKNHSPTILGSESFSQFAVLLPLIEKDHEIHVLFEIRSKHLRRQPGEICFPGGRMDEYDLNASYTAVRETSEELGVAGEDITNLSPLNYMVSPFGTIIYPFVGFLHNTEKLNPNPAEVADVFTVPLSFLMENQPDRYLVDFKLQLDRQFPVHLIPGGKNYNWQTRKMEELFYLYEDKVIWGMTARILKHFIEIIS